MAERPEKPTRSGGSKSQGTRRSTRSSSKKSTASRGTRSESKQSKSTSSRGGARSKSKARSQSKARSESKPRRSQRSASESEERIRGTAPSAADITKLEKFEPSEEAKRHEPSGVDAMGQDKRRQVVGHAYGPSRRSQIMFFVAVAVVVVVVVGGWLALVNAFDNPPEEFSERAPWSTKPSNPELAAEQSARPVSPRTPCGEPGNEWPIPPDSPCASPDQISGTESSTGQ